MFSKVRAWLAAARTESPRICLLIPYFGDWPEWIELFLESCRWNASIDWLIMNDRISYSILPKNVKIKRISLSDFLGYSERALGINIDWNNAYKICDLRLAFGHIFEDIVSGYDYFGWGDLDVIYGRMSNFLNREVLDNDLISFCDKHLNGHLCILRNTHNVRHAYRSLPNWIERMKDREYTHFDEVTPRELSNLQIYCKESFNTPLSPYIAWTDGSFEFPSEWYWRAGVLTNNKDGQRDFLYLHFMHWKGGWWPRQCGNAHWEKLDNLVHLKLGECREGFRINERGFFPLRITSVNFDPTMSPRAV